MYSYDTQGKIAIGATAGWVASAKFGMSDTACGIIINSTSNTSSTISTDYYDNSITCTFPSGAFKVYGTRV